jgi:tetratricopeptide (TPR) repeat protein
LKLHEDISQQLISLSSALPAQVAALCNICRSLEDCGEYSEAWQLLSEKCPLADSPAFFRELDESSKAEVLLRQGVLTGWLGSRAQRDGSQERAKDLISRSIEIFQSTGNRSREAEGYISLAACYHRQSLLDNGRACIQTALGIIGLLEEDELRVRALIRLAYIERDAGRLYEALRIHRETKTYIEECTNDALKGMYHTEYALVCRREAAAENKQELYDEALIQYAAASVHYEKAGNLRYQIAVENNLGFLLMKLKRYAGAHAHIDRALDIAARLKDKEFAGQSLDTRAQLLIEQRRYRDAIQTARKSVELLKNGEQKSLLVASLTTYGIALARAGENFRALTSMEKAISLAEEVEDFAGEVNASLALINEVKSLSPQRLATVYVGAFERARKVQDAELFTKLSECAGQILSRIAESPSGDTNLVPPQDWEGFDLKQKLDEIEEALIEQALLDAGGSVRRASKLLGLKSHQALFGILKRHPRLRLSPTTVEASRGSAPRLVGQPRAADLKRIRIGQNWLSGLGIYAGAVVLAFTTEIKPGDLAVITTREGKNAVGSYRMAGNKIFLDVFSIEYEAFEFERGDVAEIRKVYAWHPEEDALDMHVV